MKTCFVCCNDKGATAGGPEAEVMASVRPTPAIGLDLDIESSSTASEREGEDGLSEEFDAASNEGASAAPAQRLPSTPPKDPPADEECTTVLPSTSAPPSTLMRKSTEKQLTTVPGLEEESESILRVTSIRNVLSLGGSVLKNSAGSADTYLLSKSRQCIDIFISHNWAVPRWKKFWALALHFNVLHAVVVSYILAFVGCVLNVRSVPPGGMHCTILGLVGFFATLMFAHDIPCMQRLCWRQEVFLDKICIHQTDSALKAEGINSLGAFLRHSSKMLVLFNMMYFKKMWTVYEAACYLYLHRRNTLELLPVDCASVVLKATAIVCLVHIFSQARETLAASSGIDPQLLLLVGVLTGVANVVGLSFVLRNWALRQVELFNDLRSFRIADANCADEGDRDAIKSNICSFVRAMGIVKDDASHEEALRSFDRLVQDQMPALLRSTVGHVGVPYKYALVAGMGRDFYMFDVLSTKQGLTVMAGTAEVLNNLAQRASAIPMIFLVSGWLSNALRPRGRWGEVVVQSFIAVTVNLVAWPHYFLNATIQSFAEQSEWWLAAFAVVVVAQLLVTAKLFSWRPSTSPKALAAAADEFRKRSWGSGAV